MGLSPFDWHKRFVQQAEWTRELRNYLYKRAGIQNARRVLDVGCGTGALTRALLNQTSAEIHGLDINRIYLHLAVSHAPGGYPTQGDAHHLPYASGSFDVSLCHFVLLWLADPLAAVKEMARVTRVGGNVIDIAEPDYGGRIDYPDELTRLGTLQIKALSEQGADPLIGRRLGWIFTQAGLELIETGVIAGQWKPPSSGEDRETEWAVVEDDLRSLLTEETFQRYRQLDSAAWERGERVLFIPTFYALGRKHS